MLSMTRPAAGTRLTADCAPSPANQTFESARSKKTVERFELTKFPARNHSRLTQAIRGGPSSMVQAPSPVAVHKVLAPTATSLIELVAPALGLVASACG